MDSIDEVLNRGVTNVLPSEKELGVVLRSGKKITLYEGFDPTGPSLHIGHWIGIRKLAQFQKLGHKIIFLIGDFTGMIGDPTDKLATRKKLTKEKVLKNAVNYKKQAEKALSFTGNNPAEIKFNSEWLSKLSFEEVLELASNFTVQQMIERDFFQERIKSKKPIFIHEFLYPLLQGYDSVAMDVDLEIGGNDQLYNMMCGRTLLKSLKGKNKFVMTLKLLADLNGKKMGKSEGNAVNLSDDPDDIFGKIMSLSDGFIESGIELMTDLSIPVNISNPFESKKILAFEVVKQIYDEERAKKAALTFENNFQKREVEYTLEIKLQKTLADTIAPFTNLKSSSDAKRLIQQGGLTINGDVVTDLNYKIKKKDKIKIGKKIFGILI